MASELLSCGRRTEAHHLHLPPELLSIISGFLQDVADVIRFRSVCRSWRTSTPPLLHKISPFFPVVIPAERDIQASAIYLLRPRRDPTKAWVVQAQETAPGKLIFRHALTLSEIPVGNWPDLSSTDDWSSVTQIARTYHSFICCPGCKGVEHGFKFALITSNSPGFNQLFRLGNGKRHLVYIRAWKAAEAPQKLWTNGTPLSDFVQFNGQIYTTRSDAALYVLDHTTSPPNFIQLIRGGTIGNNLGVSFWEIWKRLVVLDGHLYIFVASFQFLECYRLVEEEEEEGRRWEKVEDLGGGVVFITKHYTFAMSARDLPPPWRGDSVVHLRTAQLACFCSTWEIRVFELGVEGAQFTTILSSDGDVPPSSFHGYSHLFESPLMLV